MNKQRYLLGSGFYNGTSVSDNPVDPYDFAEIWRVNNIRFCDPQPEMTLILGDDPYDGREFDIVGVPLLGNLGHIRDKHEGRKKHLLVGWSGVMLALAMTAYCSELDFIYKEQDCLAFGPWVEKLYRDCGDAKMVFGLPLKAHPKIKATQSLFLVKHEFIPEFVRMYISLGDESNSNFPENKFVSIEAAHPLLAKRMSFGVDRDRPIPFHLGIDKPWYCQQWTGQELEQAKKLNLL